MGNTTRNLALEQEEVPETIELKLFDSKLPARMQALYHRIEQVSQTTTELSAAEKLLLHQIGAQTQVEEVFYREHKEVAQAINYIRHRGQNMEDIIGLYGKKVEAAQKRAQVTHDLDVNQNSYIEIFVRLDTASKRLQKLTDEYKLLAPQLDADLIKVRGRIKELEAYLRGDDPKTKNDHLAHLDGQYDLVEQVYAQSLRESDLVSMREAKNRMEVINQERQALVKDRVRTPQKTIDRFREYCTLVQYLDQAEEVPKLGG